MNTLFTKCLILALLWQFWMFSAIAGDFFFLWCFFLVSCMHYHSAGENHSATYHTESIPDVLFNQNRLQWILQFQNSFLLDGEFVRVPCISPDRLIRIPWSCMPLVADNSFPLEGVILSGASGQASDNNMATSSLHLRLWSQLSSPPGADSSSEVA